MIKREPPLCLLLKGGERKRKLEVSLRDYALKWQSERQQFLGWQTLSDSPFVKGENLS
jgi:hypothetical protein